jgi:hypothetical protein
MIARGLALTLTLGLVLATSAASAETRKAQAKQARSSAEAAPDCPRASYKGDPVCFGESADALPTPSAGAIHREKSDAVRVSDEISVSGADPKDMSKRPVNLNVPNPNPRRQDVGGGAAVNYKF